MLSKILPRELLDVILAKYSLGDVYEIRVRDNAPIVISVKGDYLKLTTPANGKPIYADRRLIDFIICRATDSSLYSYNSQIVQGYITMESGIRIGVSGEVVVDANGKVKTIKNFSGLTIRVPHQVTNCAVKVMPYIFDGEKLLNTLIISPPGLGKTTLLRDITRVISSGQKVINTLVIDERYELSGLTNGRCQMNLGTYSDVLAGASKEFGFYEGVKSMRPDVVVCDEIATESDMKGIEFAINSGVKIIATAHGEDCHSLEKKPVYKKLLSDKSFKRFIILSGSSGVGTVDAVLDENFAPVTKAYV